MTGSCLLACGLLCLLAIPVRAGQDRWNLDVWADSGYLSGDMNYEIGGDLMTYGAPSYINDPLSKLEFPFRVLTVSVNASATYSDLLEARVSYSHNTNNPSKHMQDSDWDDGADPALMTIYSESHAALKAYTIDGNIKVWLLRSYNDRRELTAAFGPGVGYEYQNLSWNISGLDQWYPPHPEYGHDRYEGQSLTYDAEIYSPYVALYGKVNAPWVRLDGSFGWCFISTHERDNHILRNKISRTDGSGKGVKASLNAKFPLHKGLYLAAGFSLFSFYASGTQHQLFSGQEVFQINNRSRSTQLMYTLGLGYSF